MRATGSATPPPPGRGLFVAGAFVVLAALAMAAVLAQEAEATHFRSGTLYAVPSGGTSVSIQGRIAFRASYPNAETFPPGPPSFPCSPGYIIPPGSIPLDEVQLERTNYDGTDPVPLGTGYMKVLACNTADDWFLGKIVDASGNTGVMAVLPAPLDPSGRPWKIVWQSSARLSNTAPNYHINNPGLDWRLETTVDLSGTPDAPPRPFVNPVVQCAIARVCGVPIPFLDDDPGDTHTIRFATSEEAVGTGTFYQPGPCPACGAALPATVGVEGPYVLRMEWDTTGAAISPPVPGTPCRGTYSAQVVLEDGREKVPMDFLIHLCAAGLSEPSWRPGPLEAQSACQRSPVIIVGGTVRFSVWAESVEPNRTVQVIPLEFPDGAVLSGSAFGRPATLDFTWDTTGVEPGDYLAVFFAQDDLGITSPTCIIRVSVLPAVPLDFAWRFAATAPANLTYDIVQFTDTTVYPPSYALGKSSWRWEFADPGDASPAFERNPHHMFHRGAAQGRPHEVCMRLSIVFTGGTWSPSVCKEVLVFNRPPDPRPEVWHASAGQVRLVDAGGDIDGSVVAWAWSWGDGTPATTGPQGVHRYRQSGTYTACLTTTDDEGASATRCTRLAIVLPEAAYDGDGDGVPDVADVCPDLPDPRQADTDGDGLGDACEDAAPAALFGNARGLAARRHATAQDADHDGVPDDLDLCPAIADVAQRDQDGDGVGDACDPDRDGDGIVQAGPGGTALDNCPQTPNRRQEDADGDGRGDACHPVAAPGLDGGAARSKSAAGRSAPMDGWARLAAGRPLPHDLAVLLSVGLVTILFAAVAWRVRDEFGA